MKKQRTIWLSDEEFKRLKQLANQYFTGKGYLESFLRKIISDRVIFVQGEGSIKIITE